MVRGSVMAWFLSAVHQLRIKLWQRTSRTSMASRRQHPSPTRANHAFFEPAAGVCRRARPRCRELRWRRGKRRPATASVGNVNDVGLASIVGTAAQGQTLAASVSDLDGLAKVTITYSLI